MLTLTHQSLLVFGEALPVLLQSGEVVVPPGPDRSYTPLYTQGCVESLNKEERE